MKKIFALLVFLFSLAVSGRAQNNGPFYDLQNNTTTLTNGMTNGYLVDVTKSTSMAVNPTFYGSGALTTTAIVGVTNGLFTTNQTISVTVAGVTRVYSWVTNIQTTATNFSLPATNCIIGITNVASITNGQTLQIVLNASTNTFTWTNAAAGPLDLQTNAVDTLCASNLWLALAPIYPLVSYSGNTVTINAGVGNSIAATLSITNWGTNNLFAVYSVTNIVATNSNQMMITNTAASAATNLLNEIAPDYASSLSVTMLTPGVVSLVTRGNPGLTVSQTGLWSTNQITTNAIAGFVYFRASNTLDKVVWYADPAKDFSINYSTTNTVGVLSNWTGLGSAGYWQWTAENAASNHSDAVINFRSTVKRGL